MESGIKQSAVSFTKGMTNVPNNVLCDDDACSEVVGLTSEYGEMRPMQKAKKEFDVPSDSNTAYGYRLVYVHQTQTGKVYIYQYTRVASDGTYYSLGYTTAPLAGTVTFILNVGKTNEIGEGDTSITSVGNTLIACNTAIGTEYILWNGSSYTDLGSRIPSPLPKFWLSGGFDVQTEHECTNLVHLVSGTSYYSITLGEQENWNNFVIGEFAILQKKISKKKGFFSPFFALVALKLYDGSYYMATSPVALYPNFQTRYWGSIQSSPLRMTSRLKGQMLHFKQEQDYSAWSDIVKDVTIFVSEGVNPCDTISDAVCNYLGDELNGEATSLGFFGEDGTRYDFNLETVDSSTLYSKHQVLLKKSDEDIVREMGDRSVFYRLCDIGSTAVTEDTSTESYFSMTTLENITNQTRLDEQGGEYFDNNLIFSNYTYSYNGRLHMADIRRGFFNGFQQFISMNNTETHTVEVSIETPQGIKFVEQTNVIGSVGHYFYYPDPRAKYVRIDSSIVLKLEEHQGLNGAFYIKSPLEDLVSDATFPYNETFVGDYEMLPNKVVVSEVDNPFVFRASGYNTVGKGEVIAIISNTTALSEGQFGQYPLLAFSTDGIWALGTNSTGTYSTVSPLSREICNNADSVTQTDSAVYFTSEKGLMVVAGNRVQCVSEQLSGKTEEWGNTTDVVDFKDFLSGCSIAYDYRDSLLWIFNASGAYQWHYVYNMRSSTLAKMADDVAWVHEISDYPDTLLQNASGEVYSLLEKPDQNDDTNQYAASITTRPMKFGNVLTLKTIRQIKHMMDMESRAELGIVLYGSNDCRQWVQLTSLRAQPWKYYRIKYTFGQMAATDRFIGSVFITKERGIEKLR